MATDFQKLLFETVDNDLYKYLEWFKISKPNFEDRCQQIRDWYNSQPHLPKNALDERILRRCLIACRCLGEITKKKIDNYYTCRSLFSEIFGHQDPYDSEMLSSVKSCQQVCVPNMANNMNRIVITRYTDLDPKFYNPMASFKYLLMLCDIRFVYDTCYGDQYIWDLTHLKFAHLLKTTPTLIRKVLYIVQSCYTSKVHGVHILNCPSVAKNTINMIKSVIKKKIADRIHFHNSYEDLHKYIDPKCLPEDFGGTAPSCEQIIENSITAMQSEEWTEWFLKAEHAKSDESLRPHKPEDIVGDLLGIMGSFRKLDID